MKTTQMIAAVALLAGTSLASAQDGITRSERVRHDLDGGREAVQVRVDFAPGAAFPNHTHPGEEIAYVLQGTVEYQFAGQKPVTLQAGDALFIPAGTVHTARNAGSGNASELATYIVQKGVPAVVLTKP